ncbi:MAG TPA: penicillin-binding transpeptidase domain-containing protein [Polyangium sp.]|nr:penicillin-binding transpeptidase domain-containing protein [Polyangium sp.]
MRTFLVSLGCVIVLGCGAAEAPPKTQESPPKESAKPAAVDASRFFGDARGCFTMREITNGETFEMGGDECGERTLPASTFKIPNAIIALDSGVLKDEKVVFQWDGQKRWHEDWNRDHALPTSMWYSVVWFYQHIATEVGTERYKKYLSAFHYGNEDPSGEVQMFWLNGTLQISPREEVAFLTTMYEGKLPVNPRSVDIVKKILELRGEAKEHVRKRLPFVDQIPDNVVLSGKTGSGLPDGDQLGPLDAVGWFVGSVEKEGRRWVFASRIRSNDKEKLGPAAGKIAYEILHERGML